MSSQAETSIGMTRSTDSPNDTAEVLSWWEAYFSQILEVNPDIVVVRAPEVLPPTNDGTAFNYSCHTRVQVPEGFKLKLLNL